MAAPTKAKVIVITGASAGIGAELAKQLGKKGHHVVGAARSGDALRTVMRESAADAHAVGGNALFAEPGGDLEDRDDLCARVLGDPPLSNRV